jgi:hypothetical protein
VARHDRGRGWKGYGGLNPVIWQFTSTGRWGNRASGAPNYMDWNAYKGDPGGLHRWFYDPMYDDPPLPAPSPTPIPPTPNGDDDMGSSTASVRFQGQLHTFMRAADGQLGHIWFDEADGWHQQNLGGALVDAPSAAVTADGKRLDVVARGEDDAVWQTWFVVDENVGWHPWQRVADWP